MFSERAISAVPIINEEGIVVNLYETVDVIVSPHLFFFFLNSTNTFQQTLVRLGAYQSLDLTINEALRQRSPDFPGVVVCTANDSLGTLLQLIKKRRVHRLVVVEGEASTQLPLVLSSRFSHTVYRKKRDEAERKDGCLASSPSATSFGMSLERSASAKASRRSSSPPNPIPPLEELQDHEYELEYAPLTNVQFTQFTSPGLYSSCSHSCNACIFSCIYIYYSLACEACTFFWAFVL